MGVLQGAAVVGMRDQRSSTGNGSRFNAVKHGLTAKTPVLPGEDPAELQAKIDAYKAKYQTRDQVEHDLAEMAAMACWQAKRANRLETVRLTCGIVARPDADALCAGNEVDGLGRRLLFDRRGPWQLYPSPEYMHKQPRTSDSGEPIDPDQPAVIKRGLEATPEGCGWLLDRWFELRKPLENESEDGSGWISCQKFTAIRLLGKQPLDAIHDPEVAMVFLASHAISPNFATAFHELRCEIRDDQVEMYEGELCREEWQAITPADTAAGRAALFEIVDREIERLRILEAKRAEVADFLDQVQTDVPSEAQCKAVEQIRRHLQSANRLMLRNIDAIERARRKEAEGWYKVRRERERLKAEARRGHMSDLRFVIDERGSVRDAQGYDGDLEAGLARWKATHGPQPCEKPYYSAPGAGGESYTCGTPNDVSAKPAHSQIQGQTEAITDRACETAAGNSDAREAPVAMRADGVTDDRAMDQGAAAGAEMRDGAADLGQAGLSDFVSVTLTGQGPATNIQNEIDGGSSEGGGRRAEEGGGAAEDGGRRAEEGGGAADWGEPSRAGDPRRTGGHTEAEIEDAATGSGQVGLSDFVSLTLTEKVPATNIQNEMVEDGPSEAAGDAPIEAVAAGQDEGGETGCQEDGGGDDLPATLGEEGCVVAPRVPEPLSKRERRRRGRERARRREMARKEFERRRGVIASQPDVSVGEILDSVESILPNAVAFLRKYGPRSP